MAAAQVWAQLKSQSLGSQTAAVARSSQVGSKPAEPTSLHGLLQQLGSASVATRRAALKHLQVGARQLSSGTTCRARQRLNFCCRLGGALQARPTGSCKQLQPVQLGRLRPAAWRVPCRYACTPCRCGWRGGLDRASTTVALGPRVAVRARLTCCAAAHHHHHAACWQSLLTLASRRLLSSKMCAAFPRPGAGPVTAALGRTGPAQAWQPGAWHSSACSFLCSLPVWAAALSLAICTGLDSRAQ